VNFAGYWQVVVGISNQTQTIRGPKTFDESVNVASGKVYKVNDTQVVGAQQAAITSAKTDYTTGDLDSEAKIIAGLNATNTTLNAVITAMRTHGLIAT